MSSSYTLTLVFAGFLTLNLLLKLWLANRQLSHISQHRASVPVAFKEVIELSAHQKAADYTSAKLRLGHWRLAIDASMLLVWTLLGGLGALDTWLVQVSSTGMLQQLLLVMGFMLISSLVNLPLSYYQTFKIDQHFGFNKMSLGLWVSDLVKSSALGLVLGLPLVAAILWLMQSGGNQWWLLAWTLLVGYQLFVMWLAPNYIMPLFNKFQPLEDSLLQKRVDALMQRTGFKSDGFFVMDGSRRSAHANAYFTGLGKQKRVVFFDTLLKQLSPSEMEAVLAHELGHAKLNHIPKSLLRSFAISLLGMAALGWLSTQMWFYTGLGVQPHSASSNDALALLLFMLVVPLVTFITTPLSAIKSRQYEFEADAFACAHASGQDLRQALLKLYQGNASTLTPDPLYVAFYHSHPPAAQRLGRLTAQ
ncbi:MAG: M48 family metallopeptidase [Burkholderiales bacterium]|nr:M48 family metallopeptidase [Burkholderiales bacterium]